MTDDLAAWLLEQVAVDERANSTADEPSDREERKP